MYRSLLALHLVLVMAFVAGMLATWTLYALRTAVDDPRFERIAQEAGEWIFTMGTNAAAIGAFVTGVTMVAQTPTTLHAPWFWAKLALLVGLFGLHGKAAGLRRQLEASPTARPVAFYRNLAIATGALVVGVVAMVILRPGT